MRYYVPYYCDLTIAEGTDADHTGAVQEAGTEQSGV